MLRCRILTSELNGYKFQRVAGSGCPQGGIISPLLWNLVVNSLLQTLSDEGFEVIGFADDVAVLVRGRFLSTVFDRIQRALRIVERWCRDSGLSVNPSKTSIVLFTKKRKLELGKTLLLFNKELSLTSTVKFLGLILDSKLSWRTHVDDRIKKACMTLGQCRRAIGREWGLKPKWIHWIYTRVVLPYFLYGCLFWAKRTKLSTVQTQISHLQRMACLSMTGVMKSTPTAGLEAILGLTPLHIKVEEQARFAALRLHVEDSWNNRYIDAGHSTIWRTMTKNNRNLLIPCDKTRKQLILNKDFMTSLGYNSKEEPKDQILISTITAQGKSAISCSYSIKDREWGSGGTYLSKENNFFLAGVMAITMAAQDCVARGLSNQHINILTKNKAIILALEKSYFNSRAVIDCINTLDKLSKSKFYSELVDEKAVKLSKNLARGTTQGPWPLTFLPFSHHKKIIADWSVKEHTAQWKSLSTCKETKKFIPTPLKTDHLINKSKSVLRLVCSAITGHCGLNKHLTKMKILNNPYCPACSLEEESAIHVIADCPAYSDIRRQIWNKQTMNISDLKSINLNKLVEFLRKTKRFDFQLDKQT